MKTNSYLMSPLSLADYMAQWKLAKGYRYFWIRERDKKGRRKVDEIWLKSSFINEDNASVYLNCTKNIVKDLSSEEGTQNGFSDDIFSWDQIVCHCKGSSVKMSEKIKERNNS